MRTGALVTASTNVYRSCTAVLSMPLLHPAASKLMTPNPPPVRCRTPFSCGLYAWYAEVLLISRSMALPLLAVPTLPMRMPRGASASLVPPRLLRKSVALSKLMSTVSPVRSSHGETGGGAGGGGEGEGQLGRGGG